MTDSSNPSKRSQGQHRRLAKQSRKGFFESIAICIVLLALLIAAFHYSWRGAVKVGLIAGEFVGLQLFAINYHRWKDHLRKSQDGPT
jgi:hypothetical protein